jgi:hypothetical protein
MAFYNDEESKMLTKGMLLAEETPSLRKHKRELVSTKEMHVHCLYNDVKNKELTDYAINNLQMWEMGCP